MTTSYFERSLIVTGALADPSLAPPARVTIVSTVPSAAPMRATHTRRGLVSRCCCTLSSSLAHHPRSQARRYRRTHTPGSSPPAGCVPPPSWTAYLAALAQSRHIAVNTV